jgi:hypothetical protein
MKHHLLRNGILSICIIGFCLLGGTWFRTHAQTPEQDDVSTAKQLVGMWRLVSRPERLADGTTKQNPQSVGYLIYTDNNHMCFVSMNPNRSKSQSATAPTPEEIVSWFNGFGAYCSTVEVHAKEGFVLHHVEINNSPNGIGTTRKRWFTFDGPNRLTLKIDPSQNTPPIVESSLIFERVQK